MAIWVIKDGQREGPYEEQDVRELVYEGTYLDSDPAIRDGQFDWSTLGHILGRQPVPAEASPTASSAPEPILPAPPSEPAPPPAEPSPLPVEPVPAATQLSPGAAAPGPVQVAVIDFEMPFGSMVVLMVKWVLASIPALIILGAIALFFWTACLAIVTSLVRH